MPSVQKRRAHQEVAESPPPRRRRSASPSSEDSGNDDAFTSHDAMVKKLVRLALASEPGRKPIRRQEISDKVLSVKGGRHFKHVFEDANAKLQSVFGLALVELPQKDQITLAEKRAAQRSGNTGPASTQAGGAGNAAGSNVYILTNVLPNKYRTRLIQPPSRLPSAEAEAGYSGLVAFVVTTITLSMGQRISEGKLESYLRKANADESVFNDKTDMIIKRMMADKYIRKVKENDGEERTDYVVGARGKMEIGNRGIAGIVKTVYGKQGNELEELENALERSLGDGTFQRQTGRTETTADGMEVDEGSTASNGVQHNGNDEVERAGSRTHGTQGQTQTRRSRRHTRMDSDGEE